MSSKASSVGEEMESSGFESSSGSGSGGGAGVVAGSGGSAGSGDSSFLASPIKLLNCPEGISK